METKITEESTTVKVWFTNGSLSENWEATIDDETHELTLWDPEGNELWKDEHLKERYIKKVEVLNIFKKELKPIECPECLKSVQEQKEQNDPHWAEYIIGEISLTDNDMGAYARCTICSNNYNWQEYESLISNTKEIT